MCIHKDPEPGAAALQRCSGAELPEWARDEWNYVACKMYVACLPYTAWELLGSCSVTVYTARRGESSATGGARSAGRGGPRAPAGRRGPYSNSSVSHEYANCGLAWYRGCMVLCIAGEPLADGDLP